MKNAWDQVGVRIGAPTPASKPSRKGDNKGDKCDTGDLKRTIEKLTEQLAALASQL